jgi:hypothetical protein
VEHVVLLTVYTLLAVTNSWGQKQMKGIHWFSLYNLLLLLGAISVALRGEIPDFASIVLGNLFVVAGYLVLFVSVAKLFGCSKWEVYLQVLPMLVAIVTMVETGYVHPNTANRLIAYSAVMLCQQALIAFLLFRKTRGVGEIAGDSMGLMLAGLAMSNLVRLVWVGDGQADYVEVAALGCGESSGRRGPGWRRLRLCRWARRWRCRRRFLLRREDRNWTAVTSAAVCV